MSPTENGVPQLRVGVALLDSDRVIEDDLRLLLPAAIGTAVARVPYPGTVTDEHLAEAESELTAAVGRLLPVRPDGVMWACTSGSFYKGVRGEAEQRRHLGSLVPAGVAVGTATSAVLDHLRTLGVHRLAVGSPYSATVTDRLVSLLVDAGHEVVHVRSLETDVVDDYDLQDRSPDEIADFAVSLDHPDAEALLVSCTGLRTAAIAAKVEERTGKLFTSSNVAIADWMRRLLASRQASV